MNVRRSLPWLSWLLAAVVAACAGGSGSSGFDLASESAVIRKVVDQQCCVVREGLRFCPVDAVVADCDATPLPTATPSKTASPSPAPTGTSPFMPQTVTPTVATPAVVPTPTVTATPAETAPALPPRIDADLGGSASVPCVQTDALAPCTFVVPFVPTGFPEGTEFRVAVREDESGPWMIGSTPIITGAPNSPVYDASVGVVVPARAQDNEVAIQVAVLVFLTSASDVPAAVTELADSGADYAFVAPELTVQPSTVEAPL